MVAFIFYICLNFNNLSLRIKYSEYPLECGTDEAGRGCLAGPVTAAAVILPDGFKHHYLTDSKQLSLKQRNALKLIIEQEALTYAVAHIFEEDINKMNILQASIKAMHNAIEQLKPTPNFIAVDGNKFKPYQSIPHQTIVKGDAQYLNIAAASILAKTHRDAYMTKIHDEYPQYNWKQNKGYPTKAHREAILNYGVSKYHRTSFKLLPNQYKLEL